MVKSQQENTDSAADYFRAGLDAFKKGELAVATASLRAGFFQNLYFAPLLLGEEVQPLGIWYPGPQAELPAAEDYVKRFREVWEGERLAFLSVIWNDPLVRSELKSYVNLCKTLARARDDRQRLELLKERKRFVNVERICRTQTEILQRVSRSDIRAPVQPPFLGLIMLSSLDPAASVEFYRSLFEIEPIKVSKIAGGYAEFRLHGVHIAIHGYNQHGHGDPYRLGPPPNSLGWGAFFVIRVRDFDRYYDNALRAGIEIIDCDPDTDGSRFFVVKDPSGYVFEITEEELRGLRGPG